MAGWGGQCSAGDATTDLHRRRGVGADKAGPHEGPVRLDPTLDIVFRLLFSKERTPAFWPRISP